MSLFPWSSYIPKIPDRYTTAAATIRRSAGPPAENLTIADAGVRHQAVPDFMQIAGIPVLPAYSEPFCSAAFTLLAIVLITTGIAALLA
jgi:hypothetical protein